MSKILSDLKQNEYYIIVRQSIGNCEGVYDVFLSNISKDADYIIKTINKIYLDTLEEYGLQDIETLKQEVFNIELDYNLQETTPENGDTGYYVTRYEDHSFEICYPDKGWIDNVGIEIVKLN